MWDGRLRWPDVDGAAPVRHLYVHVPFCPTVCPFCSFHVTTDRTADAVDEYLRRLDGELAEVAERVDLRPRTVYLGGGTPSYLRPRELERLRTIIERRVGWSPIEATLEVHPATASADRVRAWRDLGFDRLSVGAQSFDDGALARLGRSHDAATARRAVERCVASGATTSVDLIVAVPGVGLDVTRADLRAAADSGARHVSAYTLTVEADTPFDRDGVVVDDDLGADARAAAAEVLGAAGFERYEPSNHARPGARCAHNVAYWTHEWFVGVGPSAASFLPMPGGGAVRVAADPGGGVEPMAGEDLAADMVVTGLRLVEGLDLGELRVRTGVDLRRRRAEVLRRLADDGLVALRGDRLVATPAGIEVLDAVTTALI